MVRMNKVYGNLMVDLKPTNAKLRERAVRLTVLATDATPERAREMLEGCAFHVKVAIVAIKRNLAPADARARLAAVHGSVRAALAE
jgi:N-acetylmuramic acid 6-phosphate etherase